MPRSQPAETGDLLDMAREQEIIDHVEREQRLHGIIREALAGLGEPEEAEALGMAKKCAVVAVALLEIGGEFGDGHGSLPAVIAAPVGSRIPPRVRPNRIARTPPAAPIPACSNQKPSGVICS